MRTAYFRAHYTQGDDAKKAAKEAFYSTDLPRFLDLLEKVAADSGSFTGKLSLADVQLFGALDAMDNQSLVKAILTIRPKLNKIYAAVAALPAVVAHKKEHKPKYRLTYFDIRLFAETSRVLFKIADIPFEDVRYPIALVDGKPVRPEFDVAKAAGLFPFGQIPMLEVDGVKLVQSRAIERYIAREAGLFGSNIVEVSDELHAYPKSGYKRRALAYYWTLCNE